MLLCSVVSIIVCLFCSFSVGRCIVCAFSDDTLVSSNLSYNLKIPLYQGIAVLLIKWKVYVEELPDEHSTPASSPWEQSLTPQPLNWHLSMLFSNPVQLTSSIQICVLVGACPKAPPDKPADPSLKTSKTGIIFSIYWQKPLLNDIINKYEIHVLIFIFWCENYNISSLEYCALFQFML